jgi:hypothetical protein
MSNSEVRLDLDEATRARIGRAAAEAGHTTTSYLAGLVANAAEGRLETPQSRSLNAAYWGSVRRA